MTFFGSHRHNNSFQNHNTTNNGLDLRPIFIFYDFVLSTWLKYYTSNSSNNHKYNKKSLLGPLIGRLTTIIKTKKNSKKSKNDQLSRQFLTIFRTFPESLYELFWESIPRAFNYMLKLSPIQSGQKGFGQKTKKKPFFDDKINAHAKMRGFNEFLNTPSWSEFNYASFKHNLSRILRPRAAR